MGIEQIQPKYYLDNWSIKSNDASIGKEIEVDSESFFIEVKIYLDEFIQGSLVRVELIGANGFVYFSASEDEYGNKFIYKNKLYRTEEILLKVINNDMSKVL